MRAKTAVIQAKRGIGDVVWHLPFVRAIASVSPGGRVAFLAPPTSHAADLLVGEPCISETIYFEHAGSELRRGINMFRMATLLREGRFDTVWILDRTMRPAVAALMAGIRRRIGLGLGPQSLVITNGGVDRGHFHDQPIDWLRALLAAMNVPLLSTEPNLQARGQALLAIRERFSGRARPWIVLGIGASLAYKKWPEPCWAQFLEGLHAHTDGTAFLIGGSADTACAERLIARGPAAVAVNACSLGIAESLALLQEADLFVGNDSGPMNLAAAVATPAFALFGATPVLSYSRFIHPLTPQGGQRPDGMQRISAAQVLDSVRPYLSTPKVASQPDVRQAG
jgi:heptosyltransferase II